MKMYAISNKEKKSKVKKSKVKERKKRNLSPLLAQMRSVPVS